MPAETVALPTTFPTKAFIDGDHVDARSGETFDSLNPATGTVLAKVAACDAADVDRAVAAARRAFDRGDWRRLAPAERKRVILKLAELIEAHLHEIALLDATDAGKPITDCETLDIPDVVNTFRWYGESIDKVFGKISPTSSANLGLIQREPIGVVAAVLPWNFPAATLSWKLAPALASGNSVIIKPAELSPFSTLRIAELATEAGVPDGVLNVVPGLGHVAGRALGLHNDVDMVTFTGSTEIGRQFLRYAADSNLKEVVLECGGKSPQLVMSDASQLDHVASEIANAAFWNMGENCTAGSRVVVHENVREELVSRVIDLVSTWKVGDPLERDTRLGPLIEAKHLDKVLGYVQSGIADGAEAIYGGQRILEETGGWYMPPTILERVRPEMAVAREEIFGPVLSVLSFKTEDEAIRIANDSDYGLAASVFTQSLDAAHSISGALRAGTVSVNCYSEGDITTPFGGYRTSGFGGRDKGLEAFEQYTELKTTWFSLS